MKKPDLSLNLDKVAEQQQQDQQEDAAAMMDQRPVDIIIVDLNNREIK